MLKPLTVALAGVIGLGFGPSLQPAVAQALPQGSYLSSCYNETVADGTLIATCKMADQTPRQTSLANAYSCGGSIANENGRLVCEASTTGPGPAPYQQTAMAKFSDGCFGGSHFIIRVGGDSSNAIRFTLGLGEIVHFALPPNSTYAMGCNFWPTSGFDYVKFQ